MTLADAGIFDYTEPMTKEDFIAIAAIFKARAEHYSTTSEDRILLYTLAAEQATYFGTINPLFDRQRFLTACGF